MRRLLLLSLLVGTVLIGYYLYRARTAAPSRRVVTPQLNVKTPPFDVGNLAKVLGAATSRALERGEELLNQATDGQAEPLINHTLKNLQQEVKDLPREQYDKVKYEFCKELIE